MTSVIASTKQTVVHIRHPRQKPESSTTAFSLPLWSSIEYILGPLGQTLRHAPQPVHLFSSIYIFIIGMLLGNNKIYIIKNLIQFVSIKHFYPSPIVSLISIATHPSPSDKTINGFISNSSISGKSVTICENLMRTSTIESISEGSSPRTPASKG